MEATTAASTPLPDTSPMTTTKRPSPTRAKSKKSPPTTADSVADKYREAVGDAVHLGHLVAQAHLQGMGDLGFVCMDAL